MFVLDLARRTKARPHTPLAVPICHGMSTSHLTYVTACRGDAAMRSAESVKGLKGALKALPVSVFLILILAPATPAAASEACPNEAVRAESNTNPVTGRPYDMDLFECRAYEMVSPLDKQAHDANVGAIGPGVSPNGLAIEYSSEGAFAGTDNYSVTGKSPHLDYIARRATNGWATEPALVPASVISQPTTEGFGGDATADLSMLSTCGNVGYTGALGHSPIFACAIREVNGTWAKTPDYPDVNGSTESAETILWGSSGDLADVVWQSPAFTALLPGGEDEAGSGAIYETTDLGTSSQLRIVSVNNENTPLATENGKDGPYFGGVRGYPAVEGSAYQAVSADGQTVYFTAEPTGGGPLTLYARTGDFAGGTSTNPATVEIARSATYWGASADGSQVFFTTAEQLASTDSDSTSDVYEYDFAAQAGHRYVQVSDEGLGDTSPGSGANVTQVVGMSSDGSHIYFMSGAVLTTIPNGDGEHASPGGANIFGYDAATEQMKFVATASVVEGSRANEQQVQVTPDGRYLIFATPALLSSEDTNNGDAIYRYDFQTGELTWISHPAPAFMATDEGDSSMLPGFEEEREGANADFADLRRAISENGEYIVFRTKEQLQEGDVNKAPDVYLWHNGEVHMISDGRNSTGVTEPPAISPSGSDVVFATTSKLVGQDEDELQDIYDARIDGGFPAPTPELSCSGEACQGSQSPNPTFSTPGTASFTGGANAAAPPFKGIEEPTATGAVKITAHSTKTLSVSAPGAGKLMLTGSGLTTLKKTAPKSGSYTLALTLTSSERKLLAKHKKVTLKVRVTFTPTSGKASSATTKITIKNATPKAKSKSKKKG